MDQKKVDQMKCEYCGQETDVLHDSMWGKVCEECAQDMPEGE